MNLEEIGYIRKFTQEESDSIVKLAGIGYTIKQLSLFLEVRFDDLLREYLNENSEFRILYDTGQLKTKALVDMSIVDSATKGNQTAQALMIKQMKTARYLSIKEKIFNGKY